MVTKIILNFIGWSNDGAVSSPVLQQLSRIMLRIMTKKNFKEQKISYFD